MADSFGWSFILFYPYLQHLFAPESAYWYYNHEVAWAPTNTGPTRVADRDLGAELAAPEVIVLLFNASNLADFDHGFGERALQVFAAGK